MLQRIVEINQKGCYLSKFRGFMVITKTQDGTRTEVARVPLDDIAAVIVTGHGAVTSNALLVSLMKRGVPYVPCASNYIPRGVLWPLDGNFELSRRIDAQSKASKPIMKRLWAEVVREKLRSQSSILQWAEKPHAAVDRLILKVRSGDPQNIEAQAARIYWQALFGKHFRRDRASPGINGLLNYGYTVLRSCTARAVVAAGLHPSLGLYHRDGQNPFRLVDDLMEPFRAVIDQQVYLLANANQTELSSDIKRLLGGSLFMGINLQGEKSVVTVAVQSLATSLAQVYLGQNSALRFPDWKSLGIEVTT